MEAGNSTLIISSGYRLWKRNGDRELLSRGDTPEFEYKMRDFGKTRPKVKTLRAEDPEKAVATYSWFEPVVLIGGIIGLNLGVMRAKGVI